MVIAGGGGMVGWVDAGVGSVEGTGSDAGMGEGDWPGALDERAVGGAVAVFDGALELRAAACKAAAMPRDNCST